MRFKAGLIIGFGVGYVLGARAGRERYEQIKSTWQKVTADERVSNATARGRAIIDQQADRARSAVSSGISEVAERIRERTEPNGERT